MVEYVKEWTAKRRKRAASLSLSNRICKTPALPTGHLDMCTGETLPLMHAPVAPTATYSYHSVLCFSELGLAL